MEDGGGRMEEGGWRMEDGGGRREEGGGRREDGRSFRTVDQCGSAHLLSIEVAEQRGELVVSVPGKVVDRF